MPSPNCQDCLKLQLDRRKPDAPTVKLLERAVHACTRKPGEDFTRPRCAVKCLYSVHDATNGPDKLDVRIDFFFEVLKKRPQWIQYCGNLQSLKASVAQCREAIASGMSLRMYTDLRRIATHEEALKVHRSAHVTAKSYIALRRADPEMDHATAMRQARK